MKKWKRVYAVRLRANKCYLLSMSPMVRAYGHKSRAIQFPSLSEARDAQWPWDATEILRIRVPAI